MRLWRAVIVQAIWDVALGKALDRRDAAMWMNTDQFLDVCDAAGMSARKIKELMTQLLQMEDREQRVWMLGRIKERMASI